MHLFENVVPIGFEGDAGLRHVQARRGGRGSIKGNNVCSAV